MFTFQMNITEDERKQAIEAKPRMKYICLKEYVGLVPSDFMHQCETEGLKVALQYARESTPDANTHTNHPNGGHTDERINSI